jgi:2-C-methyl-D-erythritol 4-phosphate cytidylyltransferase
MSASAEARLFALIPAAGGGVRMGAQVPKQYLDLAGVPVLVRTLTRLHAALPLAATFVAIAPGDLNFDRMQPRVADCVALRCGGQNRAATVANALRELAGHCAADDWVLVHDAARPCVPCDALARLHERLRDDPTGGLLALPVADTLKRGDGDVDAPAVVQTIARAGLWQAQTPQMFRYGVLQRAFALPGALECTDEAQAVEGLGLSPRLVRGSPANLKITFAEDLALACAILAMQSAEVTPA